MSGKSTVIEEYLQLILQLQKEEETVKAVNIANRLKASPSTVHATLARMQRDGMIEVNDKKQITFTRKGEEYAKEIKFRHNLAEYFLCNTLKIPWYEVHQHAHELEHAMTPLVVDKLAEFLNFPKFCPHGTPFPEHDGELPDNCFALNRAEAGITVRIVMIDESLEDSQELLKHFHERSVVPGKVHTVSERLEATKSITLKNQDMETTLPLDIAEKITVTQMQNGLI